MHLEQSRVEAQKIQITRCEKIGYYLELAKFRMVKLCFLNKNFENEEK